jgi:hypothetical protein
MTDAEIEQRAANEAMARGYYGIPDDAKLKQMSFVELASLLSSCESGSAKFNVVERELKKHLAKDQAEINLRNVILGACIGGILGLSGVVLGYYLKAVPLCSEQVSRSSSGEQSSDSNRASEPPARKVTASTPPISQSANNPASLQNNGQPNRRNP